MHEMHNLFTTDDSEIIKSVYLDDIKYIQKRIQHLTNGREKGRYSLL